MTTRPSRSRLRTGLAYLGVLAALVAAVAIAWFTYPSRGAEASVATFRRVPVQRASLDVRLRAGGRVESARKTLIECELENLRVSAGGGSISSGSRTTILEIIPDGSLVRGGDVICRLDSSIYEELVRQQEIKVQQARNDLMKSRLDLKAAEIALTEYRDGLLPDAYQALEGQEVMAASEVKRQSDRLAWAKQMVGYGYLSGGQLMNEQQRMLRAETTLNLVKGQRRLVEKFEAPISVMKLEMKVGSAQSVVQYHELRCRRVEEQMTKFRKQVDLCTIRAPHDGFVIYANEPDGDPRVELGAEVYQKMDLFYLPDLANMEVEATLHETVVDRVRPGMMVRARVEALPQYELEGEVVGVQPLPTVRPGVLSDFWIKNFACKIRLHSAPRGLLPGMTAEVDIQAEPSSGALVVPAQAVLADRGKDYCYVDGSAGLERREVTIGRGTSDLLEIREGLEEGEVVVEDPASMDEETRLLATSAPADPAEPAPSDPIAQ